MLHLAHELKLRQLEPDMHGRAGRVYSEPRTAIVTPAC